MGAVTGLSALSGISIFASPAPAAGGLDPDAAAYIANVEAADGLSLEEATKTAINDFVVGCKADGIWAAIGCSCILAGARTLSGALVPLKGPAPFNAGFVSGNYNRTNGLAGNGSNYLNSGYSNAADPRDSKHVAVYRTTPETRGTTQCQIGSGSGSGVDGQTQILSTSSLRFYRVNCTGSSSVSDAVAAPGLLGASRASATTVSYRNDGVNSTLSDNSTAPVDTNVFVFSRVNGLSATDAVISFYSIGSAIDLALLEARVATLMTYFGGL